MNDVLIIGGGPAGLTAAIYTLRYGFSATVFEGLGHGGQVATTPEVENYPAFELITGFELAAKLAGQAASLGTVMVNEQVSAIEVLPNSKRVVTANGVYEGRAIIVATGAKRRKLGCPGEEALSGRGVSYCATCDGNFFRNREVAVVGGGNTALEDALFLANICKKVTLIHRKNSFRGLKTLSAAVLANPNISVLYDTQVLAIHGEQRVEALRIKTAAVENDLPVSGVFIAIGTEPDNAFLSGLVSLDEQGYIISDENCTTNLRGVFVAGDNRTKKLRQIVTATADGAVAAFMAANYLSQFDF